MSKVIKIKVKPTEKKEEGLVKIAKKETKRFERWIIYQEKLVEYERILDGIDELNQIKLLQEKYYEIDRKIDEIPMISEDIKLILNNYDRRVYEVEIDIIRKFLEEILNRNEDFIFKYPELFDTDFAKKIYEKKEFYINKMPIGMVLKESSNKPRQRTSIQKFVKNYISEYTPYNGILLWHGVGVGKTCAGISIAENFRDYVQASNQKLLVLTPSDTLVQTWKDEIFNIEKEEMKRKAGQIVNVQCTGERYLSELKKVSKESFEISRREVSRLINKYYEIMGYQKLANQINKELLMFVKGKRYQQRAVIDYFKLKFSNRVIIMDEVHFTRENGTANDKVARPFLEMIARYAENVKLVLLSATPMYNISSEITWILNLLLWNDKRAPLETEELFEKNGITLREYPDDKSKYQKVISLIRDRSRGYISYLRSENPLTFPLKLNPWDDLLVYTPNPELQLVGGKEEELSLEDRIRDMKFYRDEMSDWQYQNVLKFMNVITETEEELDIDDLPESKTGFTSKPTQASNIVFPLPERDENDENIGDIGDSGFNSCLIPNATKKLEYASHVRDIEGKTFLQMANLGKYSAKFKNIIKSIMSSKGIIFIYSQYVKSGVRALACALEANGFSRYIGEGKIDNMLAEPNKDKFSVIHNKFYSELTPEEKKEFKPARYILLDGSVAKNTLNNLVKECRGTLENPNTNGEFIKVILGTKVIETGISFLRVREIHILDPWHHLNTMEQAAGRGIRNFSHIQLPVSERNVTLYLHIGALPKDDESELETNDERIYRRAFIKKENMAIIERQLKINAVDCGLNKMGNIFVPELYEGVKDNPLEKRKVINSHLIQREMDLYDKDYSMICDFEECYYKCSPDITEVKTDKIDNSTFNEFYAEDEIELVKELIKNLFTEEYVYTDNEIFDILRGMKVELEDHYIYLALNDLVENKNEILDGYYRPGYIINRVNPKTGQNFYIFQPKEVRDVDLPMINRYIPKIKYSLKQNLDKFKLKPKKDLPKIVAKVEKTKELLIELPTFNILELLDYLYSIAKLRVEKLSGLNHFFISDPSQLLNIKVKPTIEQLYQYSLEIELDSLTYKEKELVFKTVLPILNEHKDISDYSKTGYSLDRTIIFYTILKYYDKRNKYDNSYSILRNKDLAEYADITIGDISNNEIVGFRNIYRELYEKGGKTFEGETNNDYFLLKDGSFQKLSKLASEDLNEKLKQPVEKLKNPNIFNDFEANTITIFGYLTNENGKFGQIINKIKLGSHTHDIQFINLKFYIINKFPGGPGDYEPKYDKKGNLLKKSMRRGAKCGSAKGAYFRGDFVWIIKTLLSNMRTEVLEDEDEIDKILNSTTMDILKTEIELLLRHNEHRINQTKPFNGKLVERFFYKIEDTLI